MPDYKHAHGYNDLNERQLLEKVKRGWRSTETPCGTGSMVENSGFVREALAEVVRTYQIESVADAGAGDLNWMKLMDWGVSYQGFDLYPRHPDVIEFDILKSVLPKSDLILCRHVLNHLSVHMAETAIDKFAESGSQYLLITNCENQADYWDGYGFTLGEPITTYPDCQHWHLELYDCISAQAASRNTRS